MVIVGVVIVAIIVIVALVVANQMYARRVRARLDQGIGEDAAEMTQEMRDSTVAQFSDSTRAGTRQI